MCVLQLNILSPGNSTNNYEFTACGHIDSRAYKRHSSATGKIWADGCEKHIMYVYLNLFKTEVTSIQAFNLFRNVLKFDNIGPDGRSRDKHAL
jgi:hypothetical protein